MRILFVGDVVSVPGCEYLRRVLPGLKRRESIDFCIVNGENAALGNGITPQACEHLLTSGADLVTGGNHSLRRAEVYDLLDEAHGSLLRPMNLHRSAPGRGVAVLEKGGLRLGVANILGRTYMDPAGDPFDAAEDALREFGNAGVVCSVFDFHAEATSEKRAFGFFLDGRASAVFGTHTHVQTADAQLLPGGTAYITDVGMTGVKHSVLGVKIENATKKIRTGLPVRFEAAAGDCMLCGAIAEIDRQTGRAIGIETICL